MIGPNYGDFDEESEEFVDITILTEKLDERIEPLNELYPTGNEFLIHEYVKNYQDFSGEKQTQWIFKLVVPNLVTFYDHIPSL